MEILNIGVRECGVVCICVNENGEGVSSGGWRPVGRERTRLSNG